MTASDQIFAFIKQNGSATRPQMEIALGLCERTVDSGIRKLERLGYIKRAGTTPKEWRKNVAIVFVLADVPADMKLVGDCRGRPPVARNDAEIQAGDSLIDAMAAFFGRAA